MDALRTRKPQGQQSRFPTFRAMGDLPRNNARVWGRLLWKEWREAWPILLIGIVLPLLTLPLSKREGWERSGFDYSAMGLVGILLVLWAADRARRIGMDRGAVRQALPVSPPTRWIFLYLAPLPVPVLVGMSMGIMIHAWRGDWLPIPVAIMTGILYLGSAFLLATMLTAVLSFIPAAILGVLWLFNGIDTERPDIVFALFIKVIIACLLAALAWDAFAARQRYWAGRAVMVALLLAALINPEAIPREIHGLGQARAANQARPHVPWGVYDQRLVTWSKRVSVVMTNISTRDRKTHATFTDAELGYYTRGDRELRFSRSFKQIVQPLAFMDEHRVLIGQQFPGEAVIRLSVWDLQANRVSEHGQIAAEKGLLASSAGANLSPGGRYLAIFKLQKVISNDSDPMNDAVDLWVADLARGRAVPVMINIFPSQYWDETSVSWAPDGLYLSALVGSIRVDLKTLRGRYLTPADFWRTP